MYRSNLLKLKHSKWTNEPPHLTASKITCTPSEDLFTRSDHSFLRALLGTEEAMISNQIMWTPRLIRVIAWCTFYFVGCVMKQLVAGTDMIHSNKRITKALIRLRGCAGWSAHLLFTNLRRQVFSRRGPFYAWFQILKDLSKYLRLIQEANIYVYFRKQIFMPFLGSKYVCLIEKQYLCLVQDFEADFLWKVLP